jgi:hypothetical protein
MPPENIVCALEIILSRGPAIDGSRWEGFPSPKSQRRYLGILPTKSPELRTQTITPHVGTACFNGKGSRRQLKSPSISALEVGVGWTKFLRAQCSSSCGQGRLSNNLLPPRRYPTSARARTNPRVITWQADWWSRLSGLDCRGLMWRVRDFCSLCTPWCECRDLGGGKVWRTGDKSDT